jgi:hypothetical protein
MVDVDFVCVEYDRFLPVALVDYKCAKPGDPPFFLGPVPRTLQPLVVLADGCNIPALVVQYWPRLDFAYRAQALNAAAVRMLPSCEHIGGTISLTETQYVAWLYHLRGDTATARHILQSGVFESVALGRTMPLDSADAS